MAEIQIEGFYISRRAKRIAELVMNQYGLEVDPAVVVAVERCRRAEYYQRKAELARKREG